MLTHEAIKKNGWLIFECISGSKAHGLDTMQSDTDIRGVFILPQPVFYSLDYYPQVANETNDIVYYELRRFLELLSKNNPNIMEMLNVPAFCILHRDPLMDMVQPALFLSKLCESTFANYAYAQVKKAYGLEKKIVSPVEEKRRSVLDFCFVHTKKHAVPAKTFLETNGYKQEEIGLAAVTHLKDCYNMYAPGAEKYAGIVRKDNANDVCTSSIAKEAIPVGLLYFNRDGYSAYCSQYKSYWEWVEKRNEDRYATTMSHGKKYDSKNMMHVFRLLHMAKEIAMEGKVNVWRPDRELLLDIKAGRFEYDELVNKAEQLKEELPALYERSPLPALPDLTAINKLLVSMREMYYEQT